MYKIETIINVICISDEAHRSQINLDQKVKITDTGVERTYGFAKYLHDSLPNATYVGFTGTPVDATIEVFGGVVDAYTMTEAVRDGITVNLVYDGRAARVTLDQNKIKEIEDYYDKYLHIRKLFMTEGPAAAEKWAYANFNIAFINRLSVFNLNSKTYPIFNY